MGARGARSSHRIAQASMRKPAMAPLLTDPKVEKLLDMRMMEAEKLLPLCCDRGPFISRQVIFAGNAQLYLLQVADPASPEALHGIDDLQGGQ